MKFSALFWPIELRKDVISILDETLLPGEVKYIKAKNYVDCAKAIKDMKTRAVGQVILVFYTFLLESKKVKDTSQFMPHMQKVADTLNATRPTLSFKFLTDMALDWAKQPEYFEKSILGFLESLKSKRIEQTKDASLLIQDKDVILTHCNVSGSLPLMAEFCRQNNKNISFYATETRPYLQGARLTAWELQKEGFDVTIITDNMVAQVMHEGKISKVIVGADNLAQNGDIANKIGTYQMAILAKHFNIPFFVLCPPASKAKTGDDIKIEVRPENELLEFNGIKIAPNGVKAYYPAFDITPNNLITKHIYLKV